MSPKKSASDTTLLTRLHGKSSMSEVLMIERQRLLEQAAEEMRVQLAPQVMAPQPVPFEPKHIDTYQPSKQPERVVQEGVSRFSRFVGEDLSEFAGIVVHTEETVMAAKEWPVDSYYTELSNTLPFSSERQLLLAIYRLTVGCESFSCRVTLDVLSSASGIRNGKTSREMAGGFAEAPLHPVRADSWRPARLSGRDYASRRDPRIDRAELAQQPAEGLKNGHFSSTLTGSDSLRMRGLASSTRSGSFFISPFRSTRLAGW